MRLVELKLLTDRLAPLRRFYAESLGFPIRGEWPDEFSVRAGATTLTFLAAPSGMHPTYHFAFNIAENRIGDAREWVAGRAPILAHAENETTYFPDWNAHSVYFSDPAGNVVEFIARHNLANASARSFYAHAVLGVSEIGVPVADVDAMLSILSAGIRERVWDRTGSRFVAIGDEEGLLIVVPDSHEWFPTARRVGIWPIVMSLAGETARLFSIPGLPYHIRVVPP
jgi:catechol 2,3-dioxygenase-like lactoylglutathione lyase family enzyme